jgi:endonuclease G, mitochondrial
MRTLVLTLCLCLFLGASWAQKFYDELTEKERALYNEHIIMGQPDTDKGPVYIRHGYVLKYNENYRIPDWVAFRVVPEYLKTPKREREYERFRTDPDVLNPVKDDDYTGSGYARGHMAPYFAMGGDRDLNGKYADLFDKDLDPYDDITVFQANYMSNIAPQHQASMNGAGGPWYALETAIRKNLVGKKKMELNIIVGGIIDDPNEYKTLEGRYPSDPIAIPDRFFQVIIHRVGEDDYITAGFLFPHVQDRSRLPYSKLIDYLVTVDSVEVVTGLDFLNQLSKAKQHQIESIDHRDFWIKMGIN